MSKHPGLDLVERARALAPLIVREADEIERTRRLTSAVTQALIENGLYRALLPKSLGGIEASLEAFMQMQEEIAKADASTAWCLGQCSVCAMTAAYLDPDAANEIFNVAPGILAWGAIKHQVQAVPGGYKANARWDFASGMRQASWLGAHVGVTSMAGLPVTRKRAGYQTAGTPRSRCMSLAMSATPERVCTPATAQLLLPGATGSSAGSSGAPAKRSCAGKECVSTRAASVHADCTHGDSAE